MSQKNLPRLALLLVLVLGAWPFLNRLGYGAMAPDAALWVSRSDPGAEGWLAWDLATRHFGVGYRPVMALAITATHALVGAELWAYRATDLALHLLAAVLLAQVARRLLPASRWAGALAALVFVLHPAAEEVVPWVARKSYPLGLALGLAGALALDRAARERGTARAWLAGALFAAALLSNEVAAMLAALAGVWVLGRRSERAPPRTLLPVGVLLAAALGLRTWVVGGVGGYRVEGGSTERALGVLTELSASLVGGAGQTRALVGVAFLVLAALAAFLAEGPARGRRLVLVLTLVAFGALYAAQGVWFPRQAYFAAPLVALLVADLAAGRSTGLGRSVAVLAALAAALPLAASSPSLRGPDPDRLARWDETNALYDDLEAALAGVADDARIWLVLSYAPDERSPDLRAAAASSAVPRAARLPLFWMQARHPDRPIELLALHPVGTPAPTLDGRALRFERAEGCRVRVGDRLRRVERPGAVAVEVRAGEVVWSGRGPVSVEPD